MTLAAASLGAGAIGFLVVLLLVVASVFLFRSMSRHLRKVPKSFDRPDDPAGPPAPRRPGDGP